ncbi:hypothetical protein FGG08_002808 [Glutinoglossum americanum]|uniref:DUF676 domain-containing protein n=1 Tax=Glutinoglossum americanum TaxID=1670608 RepID=A0A9P8IEI8_9PEZI|nr:hypothetical protein FGG08_002808 [Glutinoglossum americanum]
MEQFGDERWLFINGIASRHVSSNALCELLLRDTSNHWLQSNVDRVSSTFGRPVLGIHNRSYGLIYDLLESLMQRCFSITTEDSRIIYDHLKAFTLDPSVKKVIVLAHSQGGLILSMVLDRMYADLPCDQMSKLVAAPQSPPWNKEIYTFGSAASHFNNPLNTIRPRGASYSRLNGNANNTEDSERKVSHIEHYCNDNDLVGRWGVLYNVKSLPDNRYCGLIFTRCYATGHLFNQHYMDVMFPMDPLLANTFLDELVEVDEETAVRREGVRGQKIASKKLPGINGHEDALLAATQNGLRIDFIGAAKAGAERARGGTVRQLSRLWRYRNGQKPPIPLETMDGLLNGAALKGGK